MNAKQKEKELWNYVVFEGLDKLATKLLIFILKDLRLINLPRKGAGK